MKRKLAAFFLTITILISCFCPAYADHAAAGVFDSAAALLTNTENVTLTGSATFSLDGEAFKFVETTYVQDGVHSKWVLNLSSPKEDGTFRKNGFTVIANDRFKYGMEVYNPGFYTIAEDDPQSVILRPSVALTQLISLGHSILEQLPTLPEDVFLLSDDNRLTVRMEEKDIPDSLSSLISLGVLLAVQRTMNIVDDSIAAPPYPEEAGTMSDFVTPTRAIINCTQKYELTQLAADVKMDEKDRITEANGTARFILHTFLEGEHELHISFAGKVSGYGSSSVPPFDAAEYGVEPAEGTYIPENDDFNEYAAGESGAQDLPDQTDETPESVEDIALYYCPEGGQYYHVDRNCRTVHEKYLPLQGSFTYAELEAEPYKDLQPCNVCGAPLRRDHQISR